MTDTIKKKDNNKNILKFSPTYSMNEVSAYGVYSHDRILEIVFTKEKDAKLMTEYFYNNKSNSRRKLHWTVEKIEIFESFEDAEKTYNE